MASPLTVWSTTADGRIYSTDATYATARAGSVIGTAPSVASEWFGQDTTYRLREIFVGFDTSSVGADSSVTAATLSLYPAGYDAVGHSIDVQARLDDWGPAIADADWVSGSDFAAATLLAHYTYTSTGWSTGAYNDFTSDAGFTGAIVKDGTTYLVVCDSDFAAGTVPSADNTQKSYMADDATGGGGTDRDPKLYVEWTTGGATWEAATTIESVSAVSIVGAKLANLTTIPISAITNSTAASGGYISDKGGLTVTAKGVCWNKTGTPTIADSHTVD